MSGSRGHAGAPSSEAKMAPSVNHRILLARRPQGMPREADFAVASVPRPSEGGTAKAEYAPGLARADAGFIVYDDGHRAEEARRRIAGWIRDGRITYDETSWTGSRTRRAPSSIC